jgi:hypothetical protein
VGDELQVGKERWLWLMDDELPLLRGHGQVIYLSGQLALIIRVFEALMSMPRLNVLIFNLFWCGRFGYRPPIVLKKKLYN